MKVLLDENLPVRLKKNFGAEHEVFTVRDMNWLGIKNGALMELIEFHKFEVLVTSDFNLQFQQNIHKYSIVIVVLVAVINKYQYLYPLIESCLGFWISLY